MNNLITKIGLVFKDSLLRKRVLFVGGILIVFRLMAAIPIPGIDMMKLRSMFENNQFLGMLNLFSGGGMDNLSIVMLGVGPYITGSIIMQLLTMMSPKLKALYHEEGDLGRKKFSQYSRLLTIPLALLQAFGFIILLQREAVLGSLDTFHLIVNVLVISGGSILLMWLGELMTEFGIGNGVSMLIFAGIISRIPTTLSQIVAAYDPSQIPMILAFIVAGAIIIAGVVYVSEAERPIPVTYAKRVRGGKVFGGVSTYLPLRVNQAGVIPIIFALSILLFPQMILNFMQTVPALSAFAKFGLSIIGNAWIYSAFYFILVFLFTYFYTAVTFDPDTISTNLQKSGAFIPGVRPGQPTSEYLSKVLVRITLVSALFLGIIAVLPLVMRAVTNESSLAIGGTALLIVVSVVMDLVKKVDAQISMREY